MEDIINVIVYGTPYGVPGATGAQGPVGPGSTLLGPPGPTGPEGIQGIQGNIGAKGNPGEQGDPGPIGPQGNTGATGAGSTAPGPQGNTGDTGPQGNTGATGQQGNTGSTGNPGTTGLAGDIYKSTGTAGITLGSLSFGSGVTLTVPSGLAYSKVQTVLVAAGLCQSFIATVNDYSGVTLSLVVNSVTGTAYSNSWAVNLNGAVGQKGDKGDPGIQGPTGIQGNTGIFGLSAGTGIIITTSGNTSTIVATTGITFTQTGTGFISRTIDSIFKDTLSVKDFGALGNGIADDTAAIQAALNAGASGCVYFPKGTYRTSAALLISANTTVHAEDRQAIIDVQPEHLPVSWGDTGSTAYNNCFVINGNGVIIDGLKLKGTNEARYRTEPDQRFLREEYACGIKVRDYDNLVVKNCMFQEFGNGIYLAGCRNYKILDNFFFGGRQMGAANKTANSQSIFIVSSAPAFGRQGYRGIVSRNHFLSNGDAAINANGTAGDFDIVISDNIIEPFQIDGVTPVANLAPDFDEYPSDENPPSIIKVNPADPVLQLANCNKTRYGILVSYNGNGASRIIVSGNIVRNYAMNGIYSNAGIVDPPAPGSEVLITGNIVSNCGHGLLYPSDTSLKGGIWVTSNGGKTVSDNLVLDCATYGITAVGSTDDPGNTFSTPVISGNTILRTVLEPINSNAGHGISITGTTVHSVLVTSNRIFNSAGNAILADCSASTSGNIQIVSNLINHGNTLGAVRLFVGASASDCFVSSNKITGQNNTDSIGANAGIWFQGRVHCTSNSITNFHRGIQSNFTARVTDVVCANNAIKNTFYGIAGNGDAGPWLVSDNVFTGISGNVCHAGPYQGMMVRAAMVTTAGKVDIIQVTKTAVPTTGTWVVGDYVKNSTPSSGAPKGWYCTAAGTGMGASWVSEGELTPLSVYSFNGLTGAVTGVTTGIANNFVALQSFSSGISASGGITFGNDILVNGNVRIGRGVGGSSSNLAFGSSNLGGTGFNNIAIGNSALANNTIGQSNISIGSSALLSVTGSIKNIGIGSSTLLNLRGGTGNIAIGDSSLQFIQSTGNNIAIGVDAGSFNRTGNNTDSSNSMYIGHNTKAAVLAFGVKTDEIVIGNNALGLGSNSTTIGATTQSLATIYGLLNVPSGISGINQFTLNGLTGSVILAAGNNMGITLEGNTIRFSSTGACGSCGPIILDNTVYITGVCNNSSIRIDPTTDTMSLFGGPEFILGTDVNPTSSANSAIRITKTPTFTNSNLTLYGDKIALLGNVNTITGNLVNQFNGLTGNVAGVTSLSSGIGILLTGSTTSPTITNSGVRQILVATSQINVSPSGGTGTVTLSLPATITGVNSITSTDTTKSLSFTHLGQFGTTASISLKDTTFSIGTSTQSVNTTAYGNITVTGGSNLTVTGNYFGNIVRSFNGRTGAIQGVCAAIGGAGIIVSGPTGNVTITNIGVVTLSSPSVAGFSGNVNLVAGSNIIIGACSSQNGLMISVTGGSSTSDGSAIISKLYPRLPENGLCAGDLISYNGTNSWVPTPRTYLATPSIWQTVPDTVGDYPSSKNVSVGQPSISIDGTTGNGFVVGELVQISLVKDEFGAGITFNSGTWWLNYTVYSPFNGNSPGLLQAYFSGLKIFNAPTFFNPTNELAGDIHGYAIKIRGTTYNAYDGRGGPLGCGACDPDPAQHGLGNNCSDLCCPTGVDLYPIVCKTRDGTGFTYNGVYFDCLPI